MTGINTETETETTTTTETEKKWETIVHIHK